LYLHFYLLLNVQSEVLKFEFASSFLLADAMSLYDDDEVETADPMGWAKPAMKPAAAFSTPTTPMGSLIAGMNRPKPNTTPKSLPPVINLQKSKKTAADKAAAEEAAVMAKTFTYGGSGDKVSRRVTIVTPAEAEAARRRRTSARHTCCRWRRRQPR
jgi:hypothetical protein